MWFCNGTTCKTHVQSRRATLGGYKRIIGYLKGKQKYELTITRPKNLRIISFGDGSFGHCREMRRSSTGDINTLGGSLISWRSQKTKTVCLSSTEAEYIALTEICKEQRFLVMSMNELFKVEIGF